MAVDDVQRFSQVSQARRHLAIQGVDLGEQRQRDGSSRHFLGGLDDCQALPHLRQCRCNLALGHQGPATVHSGTGLPELKSLRRTNGADGLGALLHGQPFPAQEVDERLPALIRMLGERIGDEHALTLLRSERAMTDCRPISLFSVQTGQKLGEEIGSALDKRRFRANIYMNLDEGDGFAEDAFVGSTLRIGSKTTIAILERDPRCKMITLDPDTGAANSEVLQKVMQDHNGMAGVYGAVLVEGTVRPGDEIVIR
jgi:hypothetical protein